MCISHTFALLLVSPRKVQLTNEYGIGHRTLVICPLHRTHVNVGPYACGWTGKPSAQPYISVNEESVGVI